MSKIEKLLNLFRDIVRYRESVYQFIQFRNQERNAFSGSVVPEELPFLKELVETAAGYSGPIIEIGTLYGFTTQHLAEYKAPDKKLITVDNFSWNPIGMSSDAQRDFCSRSLYYLIHCCNTELYDGSGQSFYTTYSGERPAMVFIDANHTYEGVKEDLVWAVAQGIPIISGHDYSDMFPGVKQAVNEFFPDSFRVSGSVWAHVTDKVD